MGYTHYINADRHFTQSEWDALTEDVRKVLSHCYDNGPRLKWEYDSNREAIANKSTIRFNGVDDDGHETFYYQRRMKGFWFCKTARKPYDLAVCVVLLMMAQFAFIHVTSDGDFTDDAWVEAQELYRKLFNCDPPKLSNE